MEAFIVEKAEKTRRGISQWLKKRSYTSLSDNDFYNQHHNEKEVGKNIMSATKSSIDLVVDCLKEILSERNNDHCPALTTEFSWLFLVHIVLLEVLPLKSRAQNLGKLKSYTNQQIKLFFHKICRKLTTLISLNIDINFCDALDGRLFYRIVYEASSKSTCFQSSIFLGTYIFEKTNTLWTQVTDEAVPNLLTIQRTKTESPLDISLYTFKGQLPPTFLAFHNKTFKDHLVKIIGAHEDDKSQTSNMIKSMNTFNDNNHWHTNKEILTKNIKSKSSRLLRTDQIHASAIQKLAESLVGASGGRLERQTIVVNNLNKTNNSKNSILKEQKSHQKLKKKDSIIAANIALKEKKRMEEDNDVWINYLRSLKKYDSASQLKDLDNFISTGKKTNKLQSDLIKCEIAFYKLHLLINNLINCRSEEEKMEYRVSIFRHIMDMTSNALSDSFVKLAKKALKRMNLEKAFPSEIKSIESLKTFDPISLSNNKRASNALECSNCPIEFQMIYCGEFMDRRLDSSVDCRVPFEPDGWQKKILDKIDSRESMLVVAPTSSGKTFIAFYAMQKVSVNSSFILNLYLESFSYINT